MKRVQKIILCLFIQFDHIYYLRKLIFYEMLINIIPFRVNNLDLLE